MGAAIREPAQFGWYEFEDIEERSIQTSIDAVGFWFSYFISAGYRQGPNNFSLRKITEKDEYIFSYTSEPLSIFAGESEHIRHNFMLDPKIKVLAGLADYLDLTIMVFCDGW